MNIDHNLLPSTIYDYNVYGSDDVLVGTGEEVSLPDFEALSSTISGGGIMGEIDVPLPGMFKSMEWELPFNSLYSDFKEFARVGHVAEATIRAATQVLNKETSEPEAIGIRVATRGICKKLSPGKLKRGEGTDTKATIELTYIACYINDEEVIVVDKLNHVYRVDGEDQLLSINSLI